MLSCFVAEAYLKGGSPTSPSAKPMMTPGESRTPDTLFEQPMDYSRTFAVHPETLMQFGEMTDRYTP